MMAPTHIAFGLFTTTGLFSLFSLSLHRDYPALGAAILGSLLPDIDSPNSSLGRWLPFISVPLERRRGALARPSAAAGTPGAGASAGAGDAGGYGAAWSLGRLRYVGVGLLGGVILGMGHLGLAAWLGPIQTSGMGPMTEMATKPGLDRSLWGLLVLLVAPPMEELVFRGVVYGGLHRSWGPVWAAVMTTGVFVGLHLGEIWYFWPAALSVTAVASGALVLRLRTQAMGAPIALHWAFNGVLAVICARG